MKKKLKTGLWGDQKYYERISRVDNLSHPGFLLAKKYSVNANNILDVGCGDGSKLAQLGSKNSQLTGCEMGQAGIDVGKRKYPKIKFILLTNEKLPFEDSSFDFVCSFFVLEHIQSPGLVIEEMIRVLKPEGQLVLLAPNFGAPNRCSPNFKGNRLTKLVEGFISDFNNLTINSWRQVSPKAIDMEKFQMDDDTTVEPYLGSLVKTIVKENLTVLKTSSFWDMELQNANLMQKIFGFLGKLSIYPFIFWGPHLFIAAKK